MGSNKDIAATGPNPGNTPTSVPNSTPIKQKTKLGSVIATENPNHILSIKPMISTLPLPEGFDMIVKYKFQLNLERGQKNDSLELHNIPNLPNMPAGSWHCSRIQKIK